VRRSPALAILIVAVVVGVIAAGLAGGASSPPPADLLDYAVSADGRQLVVTAIVPRECGIARSVGAETPAAVRVTVTLSCSGKPSGTDAPLIDVPIALAAPLGDRGVLDAGGNPVQPKTR
jgi:hypothetical protein